MFNAGVGLKRHGAIHWSRGTEQLTETLIARCLPSPPLAFSAKKRTAVCSRRRSRRVKTVWRTREHVTVNCIEIQ